MNLFDAHLDLALNAIEFRRDLTLPLDPLRQRQAADAAQRIGTATVTFEELRRGGVAFVVSTLLARSKPWARVSPLETSVIRDWPTQAMAHAVAAGQLAWYRLMERAGTLRVITAADQLHQPGTLGVILTLEGADPITHPDELRHWHALGLRTLMLAHVGLSHYAHGTPADSHGHPRDIDGPLTDAGRSLLSIMHELAMPLDLTHLSDTSFHEAIEQFPGRVYSSHAACRTLCDHRRNHTDAMLHALIERDGVVGLPLYNVFLGSGDPRSSPACRESVTLDRVIDHVDHLCQIAGSARHVGIGSDLDGGFGLEQIPHGMNSIADLRLLGDALRRRRFSDADTAAILGGNWMRFFSQTLP